MKRKSVLIIGAGIAGLSAGIYAQMNGYSSHILEMHTMAGGLCTAWKRKGYTIDGCIHWLTGSHPEDPMYTWWQEIGLVQGRTFIDFDTFAVIEDEGGRAFHMYTDVERLERHMLDLFPQDAQAVNEFIQGVRLALDMPMPDSRKTGLSALLEGMRFGIWTLGHMGALRKFMKTSIGEFARKCTDPRLREAFLEIWPPEFALFFLTFTFGYLHRKNAGYPLGGSLPMIQAVEQRYRDLGGNIEFGAKVEKILVEDGKAVGVRLVDGTERHADIVISAADGYSTLFRMLGDAYVDETFRRYYRELKTFPALILVGVGVKRTFEQEPQSVSGINYVLQPRLKIGEKERRRINVHPYHCDPAMAPPGKTTLVVIFESDYDYWKALAEDPQAYEKEKEAVKQGVIQALEQRWRGITEDIEMVDVATPLTFERYTGNWRGSFEGWLMTPKEGFLRMKKTLTTVKNFYMVGQWVQPGGGLPSGVNTAREVIAQICREDGKRFRTFTD